jgi:four helix bundle protein
VQLNIAEGYAVGGTGSFLRHLRIAYGSAVESGELLELLLILGAAPTEVVAPLVRRNARCRALILGLLRKLRPV